MSSYHASLAVWHGQHTFPNYVTTDKMEHLVLDDLAFLTINLLMRSCKKLL
jgi:hypothetical protein